MLFYFLHVIHDFEQVCSDSLLQGIDGRKLGIVSASGRSYFLNFKYLRRTDNNKGKTSKHSEHQFRTQNRLLFFIAIRKRLVIET